MGVWVGKGRRKKKRVLICANSAKPHSGIVGENSVCSGNTVFFASSFFGTLYGDICTKVAECRLGTFVRSKTNSQSLAQGEVSNFIPDASQKNHFVFYLRVFPFDLCGGGNGLHVYDILLGFGFMGLLLLLRRRGRPAS